MMKSINNQRGITMLEVLIALAVLSIGLAGVAIMHMNSLKYVHSAYERSVASSIALDLEERLWLAVADVSSIGCPDLTEAGAHFTALDSHWTETAATTLSGKKVFPVELEGLQISVVGTPTVYGSAGTAPAYAEVDIRLTWGDDAELIQDSSASTSMQFDYTARIYCSADYVTTIPTT